MRMTYYTRRQSSAGEADYWAHYWDHHWTVESFQASSVPEYGVLREHVPTTRRLLDAGCGKGFLLRILLREGYPARGVDFDQASVLESARHIGPLPAEVGDLNHLPYRDRAFEAVLLAGTIEHIPTGPEAGFREVNRVLEPEGILVLTIPYVNFLRKLYSPIYLAWEASGGPRRRNMHFHQFVFTRGEVTRILEESGMRIVGWQRAYYTTTLYKFPGLSHLREALLGKGAAGGVSPGPSSSRSAPGRSRWLKRIIESVLNLLMANRLIVVARKVRDVEPHAAPHPEAALAAR